MLTIAVSKGRIYEEALPLLAKAGIKPELDPKKSRKLIIPTSQESVRLLIIRATDVPTFVEQGAADMGIVGKDTLLEHGEEGFYEPLDLKISLCKLMTAWPIDKKQRRSRRLRVATKYVKSAQRYFTAQGLQVDMIKLYGSMELAPLVGLADCIVDLVDTGKTLTANQLEARDLVLEISSRLIVNKAAMKMKHAFIHNFIIQLRTAVTELDVAESI